MMCADSRAGLPTSATAACRRAREDLDDGWVVDGARWCPMIKASRVPQKFGRPDFGGEKSEFNRRTTGHDAGRRQQVAASKRAIRGQCAESNYDCHGVALFKAEPALFAFPNHYRIIRLLEWTSCCTSAALLLCLLLCAVGIFLITRQNLRAQWRLLALLIHITTCTSASTPPSALPVPPLQSFDNATQHRLSTTDFANPVK